MKSYEAHALNKFCLKVGGIHQGHVQWVNTVFVPLVNPSSVHKGNHKAG